VKNEVANLLAKVGVIPAFKDLRILTLRLKLYRHGLDEIGRSDLSCRLTCGGAEGRNNEIALANESHGTPPLRLLVSLGSHKTVSGEISKVHSQTDPLPAPDRAIALGGRWFACGFRTV
jgi:hypothetical protein